MLTASAVVASVVAGKPWASSGRPVLPPRRGLPGTTVDDSGGRHHVLLYLHDRAGDRSTPIGLRVYAHGYEPRQLQVVPTRYGSAVVSEIRVRRSSARALSDVTFRLVLGDRTSGPTATLACALRADLPWHQSPAFPLRFVNGIATKPVPLPAGSYLIELRGVSGSVALWPKPLRVDPGRFTIGDDLASTVDLPCAGSEVCVAPRSQAGSAITEYQIGAGSGRGWSQSTTWTDLTPEEDVHCGTEGEAGGGRAFWLPAGPCTLRLGKPGYEGASLELHVPGDGARLSWQPVLVTSLRR